MRVLTACQVVNILQEADKGWLQAERPGTGDRGFVPASYVQRWEGDKKEEVVEEPEPAEEEQVLSQCVVEYDWEAEEDGQINLVAGDVIDVLEEVSEV